MRCKKCLANGHPIHSMRNNSAKIFFFIARVLCQKMNVLNIKTLTCRILHLFFLETDVFHFFSDKFHARICACVKVPPQIFSLWLREMCILLEFFSCSEFIFGGTDKNSIELSSFQDKSQGHREIKLIRAPSFMALGKSLIIRILLLFFY